MDSYLPLVSVIIPAYNAEAFISYTLDSILAQTYIKIEVLVVDDGSQDRTAEIVKAFAQKDERVILLQQPNAGVAAARNLAIQKSRGEYIAPIDADDTWYPLKLEKQVQRILQAEPSVGLVYTWSLHIDKAGLLTGVYIDSNYEGDVYTDLLYTNFIGNASAPLIRRACFEQIGYYNCKLKEHNGQGLEDWDLYLRIAEHYQFSVVPEFLVGYRQVFGSMSFNVMSMEKSFHLMMADVQQRNPEIPAIVYREATIKHYLYLRGKSLRCGDHWYTLLWMYKAARVDYTFILKQQNFKLFVRTMFKLMANPITSLIWRDHQSWLDFKQKFKSKHQVTKTYNINQQPLK